MDEVKPYVIGVDLGGTNTVFGIVNQRGEILFDDSIRTQSYATAEAEHLTETSTQEPLNMLRTCHGKGWCRWPTCSARRSAFLWR